VVDVVVTDKKGRPITDLNAEDFKIEENGKSQKVAVFTSPGANNVAVTPAPAGILSNRPENVGTAHVPTVLILDATNSPFKDQAYARYQMLKYVTERGQGVGQMAVVTLTDRLHVLQQFTSDPQILMMAFKNFRPQEPILRANATAPMSAAPPNIEGPGTGAANAIALAQGELASFSAFQSSYELDHRTVITIEAMRSLARMLGGLQGRKNVVWLTAGLPFDLLPEDRGISEEQMLADLPGQGRQRPVGVNAAGTMAARQRELHANEIREVESRLANANIAIYPVDVRGLVGGAEGAASVSTGHSGDPNGARLAVEELSLSSNVEISQEAMKEVAAETGGRVYINQNEILQGVVLAAADEKASYTIGYYPENKKWDGKYRHIKVKVARDGAEARCRQGYFAIDPAQIKGGNPEQELSSALELRAPATQVLFMAQARPTELGKMQVVFLVDAHTLSAEDAGGNKRINVNLYANVYDSKGKFLMTRGTKIDRAFDAGTYQQILEKGIMVPLDVEVPAGSAELRLAVLDNKTGFMGTVTGPVE
jgi:VWFA-related protein